MLLLDQHEDILIVIGVLYMGLSMVCVFVKMLTCY